MRYETIIFDIDGTLIDSAQAILYTLQNAVYMTTGRHYDDSELHFALGLTSREAVRQLVGEDCDEACRLGQKLYGEYMEHIPLFDGMSDTLRKLNEHGIKLGIVTSKSRKEFLRSFHYEELDYFHCCICCDDTSHRKPDPEPLLTCLERLKNPKETCLYIGDSIYDYSCAQSAGIDFGLAMWGSLHPEEIPAPIRLLQPEDICALAE